MRVSILCVSIALLCFRLASNFYASPNNFKGEVQIEGVVATDTYRSFGKTTFQISGLTVSLTGSDQVYLGDWVTIRGTKNGNTIIDARIIQKIDDQLPFYKLRTVLVSFYNKTLHEPHSTLVAGMTIGSRGGIKSDIKAQLLSSGTYHMVVASGTNIVIISTLVFSLLKHFTRRSIILFVLIPILWGYAALSGLGAPIVRATLMMTFLLSAQILGHFIRPLLVLLLSVYVMLLINPLWIIDIGFYLSVGSTLSILVLEPLIYGLIPFDDFRIRGLKRIFTVSVAAQLGVLPFILVFFRQVNFVGILSNILVSWVTAPIILIGLFSGLIAFISQELAALVLLCIYPFTYWFFGVISVFS